MDCNKMLVLDDIHAGFGKKEIVKGISLSVNEGEIVSIIGPNGAGKSTLLKVMAGLLHQSHGDIFYKGEKINHANCTQRVKKGIVYFLQGGEIFPSLTVKENLEIGAAGDNKQGRNGFLNVFKLFPGIEKALIRRAGLLSGGQRQQVALAMVLLKRPTVMLLDEPSAGLSPNLVAETMEKIQQINELFGTTIIIVEQNVIEALRFAQKAYVLINGKIKEDTMQPSGLLENGKIERLFFEEKEELQF